MAKRFRIIRIAQDIYQLERLGLFGLWYTVTEQTDPCYMQAVQFRTAEEAEAYVRGPGSGVVEEFTV